MPLGECMSMLNMKLIVEKQDADAVSSSTQQF
jgi:hypothetical protein